MGKQEYLYNSEYVVISHKIEGEDDLVVVTNDNGEYIVARKGSLQKKEESYYYKKAKERKEELENITKKAQKDLDKLAEKLVDKAIMSLTSRIKFSVAFGEGGEAAPYALMLSQKLEELIRKEAPEVLDKEDPFK